MFCALCEETSVYSFPTTTEIVSEDEEEKPTTHVPAATSQEQKADRLQWLKQQFTKLRAEARRTGDYGAVSDNIRETSRQEGVFDLGVEEDDLQRQRSMEIDFNLNESTAIPGPTEDATFNDAQLEYQQAHEKA